MFGKIIFQSEYMDASYDSFIWNVFYLLIPLCIGAGIQYFYPRVVDFSLHSLTCLLYFYIISYIIYLIVSNANLFAPELFPFTWKVSDMH